MKTVAAVVLLVGLAAFGVIAWAVRRVALAGRLDPGDVVVFGVLAAFGALCMVLAWQFFRERGVTLPVAAAKPESPRRVGISRLCAAAGVVLLILAVLLPETWYPAALLFAGLAFLCVSHILTPCVERLEQLRKARDSMRQL
jgi:peptidoglycan biosynthesis protein MviN/MurJ (putative lipid II flippase)